MNKYLEVIGRELSEYQVRVSRQGEPTFQRRWKDAWDTGRTSQRPLDRKNGGKEEDLGGKSV